MHDYFLGRIRAMEVPDAAQDNWISYASYLELQSLSRASPKDRRIALDHPLPRAQISSRCD
jgi:hypothetical protein